MIITKKLINLARKWQKLAAIRQKTITFPGNVGDVHENANCSTFSTAEKGHFVVYSIDQRRFVLPLDYLNREIVRELLSLAEEEFGTAGNGHITFPFDSDFMSYTITLIKHQVNKDVEKALLMSIACSNRCAPSLFSSQEAGDQQLPICSF